MHDGLGTAVKGRRMFDNLTALSLALAAFAADLGDAMNDVTLVTVSEFGRRVAEKRVARRRPRPRQRDAPAGRWGARRAGVREVAHPGPRRARRRRPGCDSGLPLGAREILQKRCGLGSLSGVFPSVTRPPSG